MSHAGQIVLGVPLALAAAAGFGACSLLQFRANRQVPEAPVGRFTLLMWLVRRPAWRWSVVLAAVAFGLQVAALSLAPLIVVQPLLVTGLLWYVLLFAMVERVRPDRQVMLESTLCLVGLSTFLVIARPATGPGSDLELAPAGLLLGATVLLAVSLCLLVAVRLERRWRPLPLALAAGVCYGVTAGLVSSLAVHFRQHPVALAEQWQMYVIIVLGPMGVLLSQNAYQAGPLGAPALATITVTDPLVAIAVGVLWLDERSRTGAWELLGQLLALAALIIGVFLLARRAPHVRGG